MRDTNQLSQRSSLSGGTGGFFGRSPEHARLVSYIMEARMYLLAQLDYVKKQYAECICAELILQNPKIIEDCMAGNDSEFSERYITNIITTYIQLSGDLLVLCSPEDGEPCVVIDAYLFTNYDIDGYTHQMQMEYEERVEGKSNSSPYYTTLTKIAEKGMVRHATGYGMGALGRYAMAKGERLDALRKHYASGHKTLMRVHRNFKGKKAQTAALNESFGRSGKYGKHANKYKWTGGVLVKQASKMKLKLTFFKPVTILDAFKSQSLGKADDPRYTEKERLGELVPGELAIYCKKNNNYQRIINQQYFTQK